MDTTKLLASKTRVEEKVFAAAGPTGNPSWNASSSRAVAFLVGLVPVQPTPPPPPPPPAPPGDTFSYDALDRLTSMTTAAGATTTYAYAGDGLLASRSGTAYLWDRGRDPAPLLQVGSDRIVHGPAGPLYVVHGDGTTVTLARDGLGSVRAEVNGAGSVTRSARYAAYGALAASSGTAATALGFAGEIIDPNGMVYLRARWYDPVSGRFLTRDPMEGNPLVPNSLNVFLYANANPALLTDPTGKCLICVELGRWSVVTVTVGEFFVNGTAEALQALDSPHPAIAWTARVQLGATFIAGGALALAGGAAASAAGVVAETASAGGVIAGYTRHGLNQAISRDGVGVSTRAILDAVTSPASIINQAAGVIEYHGRDAVVVLNKAGLVVTTWATNSAGWRLP